MSNDSFSYNSIGSTLLNVTEATGTITSLTVTIQTFDSTLEPS